MDTKVEVSGNYNQESNTVNTYEILNVIKKYIDQDVDDEFDLPNSNIDSIIFVKMILELEEAFHFESDDYLLTISNFPTLKLFIKYVKSKIEANKGLR